MQTDRGGLLPRSHGLPNSVASMPPAWFALGGAGLMAGGFVACHISNWMLAIVLLGLLVNGASEAARRPNVRRRHGLLVDHAIDLIAQTLVLLGLGLSPYFTLCSALLALSIFLLMSSYSYLRRMVMAGERPLAEGHLAFKLCLGAALWGLLAAAVGPELTQARLFDRVGLDVCVGAAWLLVFALFVVKVRRDLAQIDEERPRRA